MKWMVSRQAIAVAVFGLTAAFPAIARAESTADEIRLLKARLKQLEAKVNEQEHAAKAHAHAAKAVPAQPVAVAGLPGPDHIYFKGLEITPGGFFAAESVYRDHWMGADINTPFQNIPYGFLSSSHGSEWRASARPSRPALMIKADLDKQTHIMAYGEVDFLGAAQTANSNLSSSYNLRLRQAYGNVDLDEYGLHVAAGQMWSLVTMNSVGIRPDTTLQPPVIDHQYMPGYNWAREPGFRITKDFNKQFWGSLALESSATTVAGPGGAFAPTPGYVVTNGIFGPPGVYPTLLSAPAPGGLFFNAGGGVANNYSYNRIPDVIGKLAWDGEVVDRKIHVEGFGILRDATSRVYGGNHSQWGGGAGGGVVVQLMPKLLDFQFSGMIGNGVGRYGTGGLPDASWTITGAPKFLFERMAMAGLTLHATPQTDLYAFVGGEFSSKSAQTAAVGNTLYVAGYGNSLYNNLGCGVEPGVVAASNGVATGGVLGTFGGFNFSCVGQTQALRQITGGVWHTIYHGPAGKIRGGLQYAYTVRNGFDGYGGAPRGTENMVFTSLRYYPFDGTTPTPVLTK